MLSHKRKAIFYRPQILFLALVGIALFAVVNYAPTKKSYAAPLMAKDVKAAVAGARSKADKVLAELFVMSQCPDAKFCENAFTQIVKKVPSVASVRTEYIATYSEADKKASCMHGDKECEGNKQQLCLQAYVPADKNQDWFLKTLMCHMGGDVAESKQLKSCMVTSGIPEAVQSKVLSCISGDEGKKLQLKSADEVKARDVKKSCTVYIDGKRRCIRDGGRWYDCPDGDSDAAFLKSICAAHKAKAGTVVPECAAYVPADKAAAAPAAGKKADEKKTDEKKEGEQKAAEEETDEEEDSTTTQ